MPWYDPLVPERSSRLARVLKWVGAATAVISLVLGARQIITLTTDHARRGRESAELVEIARQQAARGEFADAWRSLDGAEERRRDAATEEARLDVGFAWLRDARPGPGQPFSRITDAVTPALDRSLLDPGHPRRADVLAHLGWATFLRRRETGTGNPAPHYRQALAIDSANVYANTLLAHWMLWDGGDVAEARRHFDAALSRGRERPFVRTFQLAALRNRGDEAEAELIRVAASMRVGNETPDPSSARAVHMAFVRRYGPRPSASPVSGMSTADLLATYEWVIALPGVSEPDETRATVRAALRRD